VVDIFRARFSSSVTRVLASMLMFGAMSHCQLLALQDGGTSVSSCSGGDSSWCRVRPRAGSDGGSLDKPCSRGGDPNLNDVVLLIHSSDHQGGRHKRVVVVAASRWRWRVGNRDCIQEVLREYIMSRTSSTTCSCPVAKPDGYKAATPP
jgi:hypothetical protein